MMCMFAHIPSIFGLEIATVKAFFTGSDQQVVRPPRAPPNTRNFDWPRPHQQESNSNSSFSSSRSHSPRSSVEAEHRTSTRDPSPSSGSHASSSSAGHGIYLAGDSYGLEELDMYTKGGFHPVHLGDALDASGRYHVIHKLGYGGFATVWLCRDKKASRYVAVKITMARDYHRPLMDLSMPKGEFLASPLDHFTIQGPNGSHRCVVFPLLGPRVAPEIWLKMDEQTVGPTLRKYAHQSVQALKFLHDNGICHHDFRPSNILVKLRNLDHLTKHALLTVLGGEPDTVQVCGNEGADVPPSVPKYLVHEVNFQEVDFKYLSDEICLIDYGVSFPKDDPPSNYCIPFPYLPPEGFALSDDNETYPPIDGVGGDMWALGCTLFEIRMQVELFYMLEGRDEHLDEMVRLFGKLPQPLWESWAYRGEYYDDDANPVGYRAGEDISQYFEKVAMNQPLSVTLHHEDGTEEEKHFEICKKEKRLFADLLRRILRYDPAERASMDEILEHAWFKM